MEFLLFLRKLKWMVGNQLIYTMIQVLKLLILVRWEFKLFPTILWDVANVCGMKGDSTTVEQIFLLLSRILKMVKIFVHLLSWVCPSNSQDFKKSIQAHVQQGGTKVIRYPPWTVFPTFIYFMACCRQLLWVFRVSDHLERSLEVGRDEGIMLQINPKESKYLPMIIFSVSLTDGAQFYLSKHLISDCNLRWGSWNELKKCLHSTGVEYLRYNFRLVSAELWSARDDGGVIWILILLPGSPCTKGCSRWLFDRGRMHQLSSWNSHWTSFNAIFVYKYQEVNRYGEICMISKKCLTVWRSKKCFVNGEQGSTNPAMVGLNSCVSQLAVFLWWQWTTNGDAQFGGVLVQIPVGIITEVFVQLPDTNSVFEEAIMSTYQAVSSEGYGPVCWWAYKLKLFLKCQISFLLGKFVLL
ncbi:uncharacterized protein LOC113277357 isoform X2 [Papaver somniferum]|uniref:uncharacterized protein LOC113277357 isoform X2 n=1 Tax=Papaver somniferum TaxID=3469 RepID=UPI000E6FCEDD|nr:uncharacterized protein LOC113277357 isoform X2 [Papaver somniferum]